MCPTMSAVLHLLCGCFFGEAIMVQIQSSYIFIRNTETDIKKDENGNFHLVLGNSLHDKLQALLPGMTRISKSVFDFRQEYECPFHYSRIDCKVHITINSVVRNTFLDLSVEAKTTAQAIAVLEYLQAQLLGTNMDPDYIPVISYDAISEYFCSRQLNALERNLRKLLFNTYVAQFGKDYYQTTIQDDIQNRAKQKIGSKGGAKASELRRTQEFFYSLDYGEIQQMLFTPTWTIIEEDQKKRLLEQNTDLSTLSHSELRNAIMSIEPRSDWERFFNDKIPAEEMIESIEAIRKYRNSVAHTKFFTRAKVEECKALIKLLNSAILEAICITEEKDFAEKNREALNRSVEAVLEKLRSFTKCIGENAIKTAQALSPLLEKAGEIALALHEEDEMKN